MEIFLILLLFLFTLLAWLTTSVMVVGQKTAAIIEVFGRFYTVKMAGLRLKYPWPIGIERRDGRNQRTSLRLLEMNEVVSVKTTDKLFVSFPVAVQYRVMSSRVAEAFYELEDAVAQIGSFVLNVVRTEGAKMSLEQLYTAKQSVEDAVKTELSERMSEYGFEIVNVLVDEPQPSEEVQNSFNTVIAAKREKEAAENEAAAERIRLVGIAEAEKTSKRLQGEGIAAQRLAIATGYNEAMSKLKAAMPGVTEETILSMLMMTNHWDTIRDAAAHPGNVIMVNGSGDSAMTELANLAASFRSVNNSNAA